MKQIIELNITCEDYYDAFTQNMITDYSSSTGKEIEKKDIKAGLKWEKNVSSSKKKPVIARVKIIEVIPNKSYTLKYTSDNRDLLTKYMTRDLGNGRIELSIIQKGKKTEMHKFKLVTVEDNDEELVPLTFSEKRSYQKLEKYYAQQKKNKAKEENKEEE